MGKLHTVIAWLAASTLGLVSGLPHVTLADDVGPGKEVRAIRRDLPVLLAGRLAPPHIVPEQLVIDSVVIGTHGIANAEWHTPDQHRIDSFIRVDGWWLLHDEWTPQPGEHASEIVSPGGERAVDVSLDFTSQRQLQSDLDGYQMAVTFPRNDAPSGADIRDLSGRPPTEAESWITRGGNSYFFFSGTVQSTQPIHVDAGTKIDVWFPFVLDSSLYYALTIAHADKPIGPIDGTLKDNVVHFVLPAFTLPPGATLMAEIEGDSFRHE